MRRATLLAAVLLAVAARAETPSESCVTCHENEARAERAAVHAHAGVGCVACHGGDGAQAAKEAAHGAALRRPARPQIPDLCGGCHADVRRMNPYGLPTDQLAQYRTSRHGEKLAEGDGDVATCADCHGAHGILKSRDPQSPVFPKNVPATCARCHQDGDLMKRHGLKATAPRDYGQSVHARLLLEEGDLSAPTCVTCHGAHGATPPGMPDIARACGKCHVKEQEMFALTKHAALTETGEFRSCVSCHRNHLVRTKHEDIRKACSTCHGDETDPARVRFDAIFASIGLAHSRLDAARGRIRAMAREGFAVDEEEVLLEEAQTAVVQMTAAQHALDDGQIRGLAGQAGATLAEIGRRLDGKERAERRKRLALVPVWAVALGMAGLFWVKLSRVRRES